MISPPSTDKDEPLELLDLPSEILSQIASFLPQQDLLRFLSTSTALHTLTETHLTPLRAVVKEVVRRGPPYPAQFEVLPSLRHFVGGDDGRLFLDVLVRAPARWILERFEFGRWRDDIWQEAFARRFLPSWKRFKNPEDKWRAAFLRTLARLDHRAAGCAHHEAWTRFIHLRRNGSASLNRIYTRTFDPYEIMDELKHQGGVAEYPTVVRVLCHLQDVRVLAVGVLADKPSYYVNPNAHFVVHPPLLRPVTETARRSNLPHRNSAPLPPGTGPSGIPPPPPRANSISFAVPVAAVPTGGAEAYLPLVRTTSAGSVGAGTRRMSLFAGFNWRPGRRHSVDDGQGVRADNEPGPSTAPLTRTWSRESRAWSFGRGRRSSTSSLPMTGSLPMTSGLPTPGSPVSPLVPILNTSGAASTTTGPTTPAMPATPATTHLDQLSLSPTSTQLTTPTTAPGETLPTLPEDHPEDHPTLPEEPTTPPSPSLDSPLGPRRRFPYRPLQHPTPAFSHTQYPNYTPFAEDPDETTLDALRRVRDFRADYREVEEDPEDRVWSGNEGIWGTDAAPLAETSVEGRRARWVGPMIVVAQLFPSSRKEACPPGAPPDSEAEGVLPNLGSTGMYASFGWEDFDTFLPWIELRGAGADHGSRRAGMGFETAEE